MAKAEDAVNTATVYVVDDDDGMRRALSLLLNTVGYKTVAFASPKEFLDKFRPETGGCLVLDIRTKRSAVPWRAAPTCCTASNRSLPGRNK